MASYMKSGLVVQVHENFAQEIRKKLEDDKVWDCTRKLRRTENQMVLIPVLSRAMTTLCKQDNDHDSDRNCDDTGVIKESYKEQFCPSVPTFNNLQNRFPSVIHSNNQTEEDIGGGTGNNIGLCLYGIPCSLREALLPLSKKEKLLTPYKKLKSFIEKYFHENILTWKMGMEAEIPNKWEVHGDLFLIPNSSFCSEMWSELPINFWQGVVSSLGGSRLAKKGQVRPDDYRSPTAELIIGDDGWVTHVDNSIKYTFDIRHCMFSSGNITEKSRIGNLCCKGETLVDLYAGIGYFTLPFLVLAEADFVHACEWNPHAVAALKRNLVLNKVDERCQIHVGDNRKVCPENVADRVNLGLIPSSEPGWQVSCAALKPEGGVLHIHGNVESLNKGCRCEDKLKTETEHVGAVLDCKLELLNPSSGTCKACQKEMTDFDAIGGELEVTLTNLWWCRWALKVRDRIEELLEEIKGGLWKVNVLHLEHVKSYAPHVDHMVVDLECKPRDN